MPDNLGMNASILFETDAAEHLRVTRHQLRKLVKQGVLPAFAYPGGELAFHVDDLDAWLLGRRINDVDREPSPSGGGSTR